MHYDIHIYSIWDDSKNNIFVAVPATNTVTKQGTEERGSLVLVHPPGKEQKLQFLTGAVPFILLMFVFQVHK